MRSQKSVRLRATEVQAEGEFLELHREPLALAFRPKANMCGKTFENSLGDIWSDNFHGPSESVAVLSGAVCAVF